MLNSNFEPLALNGVEAICKYGILKMDKGQLGLPAYIRSVIGTDSQLSSILTVGRSVRRHVSWGTLQLTFSQQGGGIRGFMNDGTIDYKNYHSVDSLAFGHCDYSYRNLGRPSKIRIRQEANIFEVIIDDRVCFSTDKVNEPSSPNPIAF